MEIRAFIYQSDEPATAEGSFDACIKAARWQGYEQVVYKLLSDNPGDNTVNSEHSGGLDRMPSLIPQFYQLYHALLSKGSAPTPDLSPREIEVLQQYAYGKPRRAVAFALGITESAVKFHSAGFLRKLASPNITAAVLHAFSLGLIAR